eukprot:gene26166-32701_t
MRTDTERSAVVISSTSWTEDEDFNVLLNALLEAVRKYAAAGLLNVRVSVRTLWLSHGDYPLIMRSLDLPMKVYDMLGSGVPVCAVQFDTIGEL